MVDPPPSGPCTATGVTEVAAEPGSDRWSVARGHLGATLSAVLERTSAQWRLTGVRTGPAAASDTSHPFDMATESGTAQVTTGDRGGADEGDGQAQQGRTDGAQSCLDRTACATSGTGVHKYFAPGRANSKTHKDIGLYAHVVDSSFLGLLEPLNAEEAVVRLIELVRCNVGGCQISWNRSVAPPTVTTWGATAYPVAGEARQ